MVEPLFQVTVQCIHCESSFKTSRVRPSFKKASGSDSDFCLHYKEINPDHYVVRVCPFCGFASTENFKKTMSPAHKKMFVEKVGQNWVFRDYGNERTFDEALQAFKLGLLCAQIKEEKDRVIAGLLHHIAWMYRVKGDTEQEKRFLEFALESYTRVFEREPGEVSNARLMYLLGELNRRLKNYNVAVKWFARVVNDKSILDSGMIRACRDMWAETRQNMQDDKVEMTEDIGELK